MQKRTRDQRGQAKSYTHMGQKPFFWLCLSLLSIGLARCDSMDNNELDNRQGPVIGSQALEGKRFDDGEFKCLTLESELNESDEQVSEELLLQAKEVTYKSDIEPLFAAKCVACHPAVSPPDLKTYDAVKKTATANYNSMVDGSMPPGKPMPASEIALFKTWMDTGMLEAPKVTPTPPTPPSTPQTPPPAGTPAPPKTPSAPGGTAGKTNPKPKTPPKPAVSPACVPPTGLERSESPPQANTGPKDPAPAGNKLTAVYLGGIEPLLKTKCVNCHGAGAIPPDLSTYELAKKEGASSKATIDNGTMPPPATKVLMTDAEKALFSEWVSKGYPEK